MFPGNRNPNGGGDYSPYMNGNMRVDVSQSNLRASAVEFIPRAFVASQPSFPNLLYQQNVHGHTALSSQVNQASHFLLQQAQQQQQQSHQQPPQQQQNFYQSQQPYTQNTHTDNRISNSNANSSQRRNLFTHDDPVQCIKQAIKLLRPNPDNINEILSPLTESISKTIYVRKNLFDIAEELLQQSIAESLIRYTGARICNHFFINLTNEIDDTTFQKALLHLCDEEYSKREESLNSSDKRDYIFGFALFMGELLLNLHVDDSTKIKVSTTIKNLINFFLDTQDELCLKCVTQILKASDEVILDVANPQKGFSGSSKKGHLLSTGAILEDFEKKETGKVAELDDIFGKIKLNLLENKISRSCKSLLLSVVELRAKDWGRKDDPNNPANPYLNQTFGPVGQTSLFSNNNPVELSNSAYDNYVPPNAQYNHSVENQHLWSNAHQIDECFDLISDFDENEFAEYAAHEDEFNDEIANAYEEFLLENERNNYS